MTAEKIASSVVLPLAVALLVAGLAQVGPASAQDILTSQLQQGFGKNKVRYKDFDWWILESEHVDLYYEPEFHDLAEQAIVYLEAGYDHISEILHHDLSHRPPVVIFKSHYEFQQTNIIHEFLPPGVAGFAEPLRYRMVIPFSGDLDEFRNVLVHELTHIFQYDILYKGPIKRLSNPLSAPPTWIMEGLAEYTTPGRNTIDEMVLRDAVLTDQLIPLEVMNAAWGTGNVFLGYKQSHSLMEYIAHNYGPEKISRILRLWDSQNDSDKLLERLVGLDMGDLHERWSAHMRKQYWPLLQTRDYVSEIGKRVAEPDNPYQSYAAPKWSLSGDMLAVLSSDAIEQHVDIIRLRDGSLVERVTTGMHAADYDHLTFGSGTVAWAPDGHTIAFVAKKGARDQILLWELYDKKLKRQIDFEGLEVIEALDFDIESQRIVFVGSGYGQSDLYTVDISSGELTQITGTPQRDDHPAFSPDGRYLAYCSKHEGQFDVKVYDFETGKTRTVVQSPTDDMWPRWFPDGKKLLFVSTRDKINDLFVFDLDSGREYRLTRTLSGIMSPDLSPDGQQVVFSTYYQGKRELYRMDIPDGPELGRTHSDLLARATGERGAPEREEEPAPQLASPVADTTALAMGNANFSTRGDGTDGGNRIDANESVPVLLADMSQGAAQPENSTASSVPALPAENELGLAAAQNPTGELRKRRYVPKLEFEGVSLQMGYSSGGFLSSVAQLSMSDLLGNHFLALYTDYVASQDINNDFNFAGSYQYYGGRPTYSAAVFNWNQFFSSDPFGRGGGNIVRSSQRGVILDMSYPVDIYRRVDFNYTFVGEKEEEVWSGQRQTQTDAALSSSTHLLKAAYVHDSITYGLLGPTAGRRYFLSAGRTLDISADARSFSHVELDYRHYFRFGRWSVLGMRFSGVGSLGRDSLRYNLGGPAWWQPFYAGFNLNTGPLRGYGWSELQGSRVTLMNAELRVPFIRGIAFGWPGSFVIPAIDGTAFLDMGTAWNEGDEINLWPLYDPHAQFEPLGERNLRASIGFGLMVYFILPMNFEWAKQTDLQGNYSDYRFHFSFGQSF